MRIKRAVKTEEAHRRLQRLNTLLSLSQDDGAQLGPQVYRALEGAFDPEAPEVSQEALREAIETLRRLYTGQENAAFSQVDLSDWAWGPLWVRAAVSKAMRPLVGYPDAVLLVSGLGRYVCPSEGRWSRACRADYASMRRCVESVASGYLKNNARLRILFI